MTERMAEQDDPFLLDEEAARHPTDPRVPILPAEWQRTDGRSAPTRRKRRSRSGGESAGPRQ